MATIRDVAKLAGVSPATVSRVINGSHPVKAETKKAVERAIAKLHFTPALAGQSLSAHEKRTLLLIAPVGNNEQYNRTLLGINRAIEDEKYNLLMTSFLADPSDPEKNNWARCARYIDSGLIDGVILLGSQVTLAAARAGKIALPVVQCCDSDIGTFPHRVAYDNQHAAFELTERLIAQGRRRFAFALSRKEYEDAPSDFSQKRLLGMRAALEQHQIPYDPRLTVCCVQSANGTLDEGGIQQASGERARLQFYADLPPEQRPDAILCSYDSIAFSCIAVLQRAGIAVPQQIAVAGFDDSFIAQLSSPQITSVQPPSFEMGYETVRLLLSLIRGERKSGCQILLSHRLVERGSTNPAPEKTT